MRVPEIICLTHYTTTWLIFKVKKLLKLTRLWEYSCTFFMNSSTEIKGIGGLRSVNFLIAKVIWGQNVSWLHLHFYISSIYWELKAFLETHPRVICSFMRLIDLSCCQARTISRDVDSNKCCKRKLFFFKYKVWLFQI